MTTEDLSEFIRNLPQPVTLQMLEVNSDTYSNVIQFLFDSKSLNVKIQHFVSIPLGKHNGLMFKGIELILKRENSNE